MRRRRSYEGAAHKQAKKKLAAWLRQAARNEQWGLSKKAKVYAEYPLMRDNLDGAAVWADGKPPSFRAMTKAGYTPKVILDVCIIDDGLIIAGFEVLNEHPCTPAKVEFLAKLPFETLEIDCSWILSQRFFPTWEWSVHRRFGAAA